MKSNRPLPNVEKVRQALSTLKLGARREMTLALSIATALASTTVLVAVTESMPARIRCGSLGLIYAFAISVFGGSTQFAVAWLTGLTHNPLAPAWYGAGAIILGLAAMTFMPETAPALGSTGRQK